MLTIYTVTYNEELLIQLMIDHYRSRFPNCHIVVYDNQSTDKTVEIAKQNNCEIRYYNSNNQVNDQMLWDTKNTCWKDAKTDWVLVCDLDEMLDITQDQLIKEEKAGVTKIKSECYHMVNMRDDLNVRGITYGFRDLKDTVYDKDLLFNKKYVNINYINNDCHFTRSTVKVVNSKTYLLYHYKYVNPDVFVNKQKSNALRFSDINRKNNWGVQCLRDEGALRNEFNHARNNAVKVLNKMNHFYQNIPGWFNFENYYSNIIKKLPDNSHIVEVGCWKGRSVAFLAVEAINSWKSIKIDAVDTWTGDLNDPTSYNSDQEFMKYNRNIYELFKQNLNNVLHIVNPIQLTSVEASKLYEDKSLDFVFIDANHIYESVREDILAYLPKIKPGGIFAGHDYNRVSFPGVVKAVHEIFGNKINIINEVWEVIV